MFRTTTRLVQVDMVVTDKQGRPIPGLTAIDFTVMQDGKPQKFDVFEAAHRYSTGVRIRLPLPTPPKLPPNTYSNHPSDATADSWTIVLFDLLNTPTSDQEYARKQLIELLRTAPKGQPIALYLLTNRLTMVQGFTDDPEKLLKVGRAIEAAHSHVLTTEAQRQHAEGQIAYADAESTESAPSIVSRHAGHDGDDPGASSDSYRI